MRLLPDSRWYPHHNQSPPWMVLMVAEYAAVQGRRKGTCKDMPLSAAVAVAKLAHGVCGCCKAYAWGPLW